MTLQGVVAVAETEPTELPCAANLHQYLIDALGTLAGAAALSEFRTLTPDEQDLVADVARVIGRLQRSAESPKLVVDEPPARLRLAAIGGQLVEDVYQATSETDAEPDASLLEVLVGGIDELERASASAEFDQLVPPDADRSPGDPDDATDEFLRNAVLSVPKSSPASKPRSGNPDSLASKFLSHLMSTVPISKTDIPEQYRGRQSDGSIVETHPAQPSPAEVALERHRAKLPAPYIERSNKAALDLEWQEVANCMGVDPELFFPGRGESTKEAKAVCQGCEVRHDCLEYAIANGEKFGIWGGLAERERRRVRRQRALVRATEAARAAQKV